MEIWHALLLIGVGLIAGFINSVAGGGSLLTLPILIFLGLPPAVANGSNRISVLAQTAAAAGGYYSKGIRTFPYSLWVGLAAVPGALVGAWLAVDISGALFNKILAGVMIIALASILLGPWLKKKMGGVERMETRHKVLNILIFFLIGVYGGFIQAGIRFVMLVTLNMVHGIDLAKANSIKVSVVFIYTVAVLGFFIWKGKIDWMYGLTLAMGTSVGAWIGSRWAAKRGDLWIRVILVIMVIAMAIKLFFFDQ